MLREIDVGISGRKAFYSELCHQEIEELYTLGSVLLQSVPFALIKQKVACRLQMEALRIVQFDCCLTVRNLTNPLKPTAAFQNLRLLSILLYCDLQYD